MEEKLQHMQERTFDGKGAVWPFFKRLLAYAMPYKKELYTFLIFVILVAVSDALWPLLWKYFLDEGVLEVLNGPNKDSSEPLEKYEPIIKYASLFLLNGFLQVLAVYGFIRYAGRIEENVLFDLRQAMFNQLQRLSFSFFDRSQMGWLISRISSDTVRVCELISWGLLDCFWGITMIFACLFIMFIYQWKLALIVTIAIPILIVSSFKIRMLILKYSRKSRKVNSEITASYAENINGVEVNKLTASENRASSQFRTLSTSMKKVTFRSSLYTAVYTPLVILIGSLTAMGVIYWGGKMAVMLPIGITIGTLAAFFGYATRIFEPILDISRFYSMAQGSLSAGERIFSLLDENVEIKDGASAKDVEHIKGRVEFRNVDFHYEPSHPVLKDFNLKVEPGQSIALVGPTGEGKSTIVNLIARFYEPVKGEILIDDVEYRQISIRALRSRLGMVLQTPHLFSGTLASNVRYGRQNAGNEEIIEALKRVGADHLVERINEEVGEGGERFSTGEKQLISFARAVLVDPAILIMDEATSSIDATAEARIQQGVEKLLKGRTSFIIAHRLSTIKNCDRILVIRKGAIIEDGSHAELMDAGGAYYDLYTGQLGYQKKASA